jgi:hypothetical protein
MQRRIRVEYEKLPEAVQSVAWHYLAKRVRVLPDPNRTVAIPTHPLSPQPIPYLAFWFARDFGVKEPKVRRLLALAMAYVCAGSSPRDDLVDGVVFAAAEQNYVARWLWELYFDTLKELFPSESATWYLVAKCEADWSRSDRVVLFSEKVAAAKPLSRAFLRETSRYLAALITPTLAGVALLKKRLGAVSSIERFCQTYCMGWRILDDLRDWDEDRVKTRGCRSSVLALLRLRAKIPVGEPLSRELAVSLFADAKVTGEIYGAMTKLFRAARREAERLEAATVVQYIDLQMEGHRMEVAQMAAERKKFQESLKRLLEAEAMAQPG